MLDLREVAYDHPDAVALTEQAQSFYLDLYGGRDDSPVTSAEFAPPLGRFVVGYLDSAAVAMGGWRFSDAGVPPEAARPAELKRMFVREHLRRTGLAGVVLAALEESAADAGADWLILQTGAPQVAAVAFYAARGYRPIPTYGHYAHAPEVVNLGRRIVR